jgi:hypothetical protein
MERDFTVQIEALAKAKLAASRAVEAMTELQAVSRSMWRGAPLEAAKQLVFEVDWVAKTEEQ